MGDPCWGGYCPFMCAASQTLLAANGREQLSQALLFVVFIRQTICSVLSSFGRFRLFLFSLSLSLVFSLSEL